MSGYVIWGLVCGVIGFLSHIEFSENPGRSLGRGAISFIINAACFVWLGYLLTPFFYGPFFGLSATIIIVGAINLVLASMVMEDVPPMLWLLVAFVLVVGFRGCAGSAAFNAEGYRSFLGDVETREWTDDMQPVDPTHVRAVSKQQAQWLGDKALGQAEGNIGSKFKLGEYSIQRVQGELNWVAPLEYRGFSKWTSNDHTPGFVVVSAEDRNRSAELIVDEDIKIRYMPSAFFGRNLERHLNTSGYANYGLTEYSFELDEEMNPHWVISVFEPSIHYFGSKVLGVLIVDPESGEAEYRQVGNVPDWVDRVYPESLTEEYATWYGKYVQGWVNSWWGEQNIEVPTKFRDDSRDMTLVYGKNQKPMWFTGLTSVSSSDQSLTSVMLVNSRTGKAFEYDISGVNEAGVIDAVNSAVSNYQGYRGTQPIPYNIYGEFSWAVPVVSEKKIFQKMAFVNAANATVSLGDDVASALQKYRNDLPNEGFSEALTKNSSYRESRILVSRVGSEPQGEKVSYHIFSRDSPNRVFVGSSSLSSELAITQPGDSVVVTYRETGEAEVSMQDFDNAEFELRASDNQQQLNQRRDSVQENIEAREEAQVLEKRADELSDEKRERIMDILESDNTNN